MQFSGCVSAQSKGQNNNTNKVGCIGLHEMLINEFDLEIYNFRN